MYIVIQLIVSKSVVVLITSNYIIEIVCKI